jgi:prevent-host-death family protein
MGSVPDIIPISELRKNAAGIIKKMKSARQPVVITQHGRASAVLVSAEDYRQSQRESEILRSLANGEREIAEGKGSDLESVFAKVRELLGSRE